MWWRPRRRRPSAAAPQTYVCHISDWDKATGRAPTFITRAKGGPVQTPDSRDARRARDIHAMQLALRNAYRESLDQDATLRTFSNLRDALILEWPPS